MIINSFAVGQPIPDAISKAPVLEAGLGLYWWAFWELVTDRNGGWGLMPIPWSSIKDFSEAYTLDDQLTDTLFHHVRGMDKAYREYFDKKDKKSKK